MKDWQEILATICFFGTVAIGFYNLHGALTGVYAFLAGGGVYSTLKWFFEEFINNKK